MNTIQEIQRDLVKGDRVALSKAITLVESNNAKSRKLALDLLQSCPRDNGKSICIAISGSPGVGKSSLIEKLGLHLLELGKRVAVLTIDPSSQITGGSILGDQTRMEELSKEKDVFIRQTPSAQALGGIGHRTRETIHLCQNAGYDIILLETVGVGQAEFAAFHLSDLFVLMILPGSGDDLQGIKRGIVEMAGHIVISKSDGERQNLAKQSKTQFISAVHLLHQGDLTKEPLVDEVSILDQESISRLWNNIAAQINGFKASGSLISKRKDQDVYWLKHALDELWIADLKSRPEYENLLEDYSKDILEGRRSAFKATTDLFNHLKTSK